jgi:TPR repeat protein
MRLLLLIAMSLIIAGCHMMKTSNTESEEKMISGVADLDLSEQELQETQKAAEAGDFEACYRLHMYYEMVVGDFIKSDEFLRRGAEGGHAKSQYSLGVGLISKPQTYEEGVFWLKRARDAGYPGVDTVLNLYKKNN